MAKTKLLGKEKDRQLKEQKKIAQDKNKKKRRSLVRFFKDVVGELKKVTWASGKDLMKTSLAVIIFIGIFTVIVGLIDWGLGSLFSFIIT
jgi:preprotein translocase, SecE subunit, bacterial